MQLGLAEHIKKIKPIPIQGDAKNDCSANTREVRMLRGLLRALHCRGRQPQRAPHLSCSVTILQGTVTKATIRDIREVNKLLRITKVHKDVALTFPCRHVCRRYDLGLLTLSDATWATKNEPMG